MCNQLFDGHHLKQLHGAIPERIQVDNGSEFISKAMDKWAYNNFSRPGKPTVNRILNHSMKTSGMSV